MTVWAYLVIGVGVLLLVGAARHFARHERGDGIALSTVAAILIASAFFGWY